MAIRQITTAAATAALMMLAGAGLAAPDLTEVTIGGAKALADARGMTLYTFDKDKAGASACYDGCATKWPPALAPDGAKAEGDYGVTERKDNTYQWTYRNMPLYTYYEDKAAGDATGDGMGGVWHIARP